jgi:hypothetical protein
MFVLYRALCVSSETVNLSPVPIRKKAEYYEIFRFSTCTSCLYSLAYTDLCWAMQGVHRPPCSTMGGGQGSSLWTPLTNRCPLQTPNLGCHNLLTSEHCMDLSHCIMIHPMLFGCLIHGLKGVLLNVSSVSRKPPRVASPSSSNLCML